MERSPVPDRLEMRPARFRSLASKFSLFTAVLVLWVVVTVVTYGPQGGRLDVLGGLALCVVVVGIATAIARFTISLIARPLSLLQEGITAVKTGRLEPVRVSRTGDEIEYLGDAFNQMIAALAESRAEVRTYQEHLEERIGRRTEELEATMHRALAASQAKSEFLANVSHELRTPMNGIIGMLDIVLDSALPAEQRDQLETAQRCAYSLLSIVNDLLDLAKIEAGRMVLQKAPVDIRSIVQECVASHRSAIVEKSLALDIHVDASVPEQVLGDPLRIRQIVSNLIGNAVKFTPEGRVGVSVRTEPAEGRPFELEIVVSDTGTGIPEDRCPFIFDKFTQADGSISRKYGGTGLGLAITKHLSQLHGGDISVESRLGEGSRFTVRLLCAPVSAGSGIALEPVRNDGRRESTLSGRGRILVVEDNLVNQKVVTAILRKAGYEPLIANHGQEALDVLAHSPDPRYYRAVLMDVQMPVLDGLEATRLIRRDTGWDHLPILAMTAHAMDGDRDRCLQAGMNGYLAKPVNATLLLNTLERFIDRDFRDGMAPPRPRPPQQALTSHTMGSDRDLVEGMIHIFLQLAPDRLQRLSAAAIRRDAAKVIEESQKISSAADHIAATGVTNCTREIKNAATAQNYEDVQHSLVKLAGEISALQRHLVTPIKPPVRLAG